MGGARHEVMWSVLERRPLTRLGMLAKAKTHEDILKEGFINIDYQRSGFSVLQKFVFASRPPMLEQFSSWWTLTVLLRMRSTLTGIR